MNENLHTEEDVLGALDSQVEDYRAMQQVSIDQGRSIASEDLPGLSASFERMHRLTDRIRLRQANLPADLHVLEARDAKIAGRLEAIRGIIRELLQTRNGHERSVRNLIGEAQAELKMLGHGQRVARRYQNRFAGDSRFFDGTR